MILNRRLGETLILELSTGETIEVSVLEINGNQARLGTEAPEDVHIAREELLFDKKSVDSSSR